MGTSLLAAVVGVPAYQGTRWTVAGEIPKAEGPHHPSICPYGLFHASDGAGQISVGSENLWQRFAPAFRLPVAAVLRGSPLLILAYDSLTESSSPIRLPSQARRCRARCGGRALPDLRR